ncbi:MAG: hypothetical protein A2Z14_06375 [Chloroflexi bacterium RBG_16_48_8]|nr:MAG: hypothetical protein A2Z14_06375 [Chloroflexi bacterium RBG_16_48_8]
MMYRGHANKHPSNIRLQSDSLSSFPLVFSYPIFWYFPARDFSRPQSKVWIDILEDLSVSISSQSGNWGKGLVQ